MPENQKAKRTATATTTVTPRPRDRVTMLLMLAAAAAAVVGLGAIFSAWWGNGPPDPAETMKLASRQYVEGRPVLAGELARTVKFSGELDSDSSGTTEPVAVTEPANADINTGDLATGEAATGEAATDQNAWQNPLQKQRDFLIAAGLVARAKESDLPREKRQWLSEAVPLLEKVAASGFPVGREIDGNRLLGEAYFELGEFDKVSDVLRQSVQRDPTLRRTLLPVLAQAQLKSKQPSAALALSTISEYLDDETLGETLRHNGNLIRIDALTELGRYKDAEELAQSMLQTPLATGSLSSLQTPDYAHQIKLARGIIHVRRAMRRYGSKPTNSNEDRSAVIAELAETMADFDEILREALPDTVARTQIWAARAWICQGLFDRAFNQMTAVRQQRPFAAEAIVGGLEEIELLAALESSLEMLQAIRFVIRELGDRNGFDPSLISFLEFQRRIIHAIEILRNQGHYETAIDISRTLTPVFSPSEALIQEGLSYQDWAHETIKNGTGVGGDASPAASSLARTRFRAAGDAFARAAELEFDTQRFLPTQWSAIDAYQRGRHFERSIRLLRSYLRYEERRRQPRGLVAFGRALLANNEPAEAIEPLEACVSEFPRDPLRYDARLLLAMAYSEQGDFAKARQYLMDNLQDGELTPQSPAWRDSLFTLAELLYQKAYENHLTAQHANPDERMELLKNNQPILLDAIRRLDEASDRYWPHRRAETADYLAARCHVLASQWPRLEAKLPEILDAARRSLRNKVDIELEAALNGFRKLKNELLVREDEGNLTADSAAMLRNCFMSEADTLKDLQQYEQATTAYRTIALRYMNEPPALEAILGQVSCARSLGRTNEAGLLIRQADVVLQRIPASLDDQFVKTTRYDRKGWQQLIDWMKAGIELPDELANRTG